MAWAVFLVIFTVSTLALMNLIFSGNAFITGVGRAKPPLADRIAVLLAVPAMLMVTVLMYLAQSFHGGGFLPLRDLWDGVVEVYILACEAVGLE